MHVPRRFILGLICGLVLAIGAFVALLYTQLGIPTNSSSWAYAILQKKVELAATTPGPKLLLVGGSGTTFGLSAGEIEKQTGYHALNMGTHAGLGLDHILYWAKKEARPGDTVLLIPEYELYLSTVSSEPKDDYVLAHDVPFFHQLTLWEKIQMATRIPFKRIQKGFHNKKHPEQPPRPHPPYTDGAGYLDQNADETGNYLKDRPLHSPSMDIEPDVLVDGLSSDGGTGFGYLRDFIRWAKAHQVRVLATFPNIIHQPDYDKPHAEETIKTITEFYRSLGIPLIGSAQEAMLPKDEFFDTYYHLTHEAALARTDRLVPYLKPYLTPDK